LEPVELVLLLKALVDTALRVSEYRRQRRSTPSEKS
jgi:hypothetical protein